MAVISTVTYFDLAENLHEFMGVVDIFAGAQDCLTVMQGLNPGWLLTNLSQDELDALLNMLTRLVVSLNSDLNCYPLGLATVVCFDINGDPIP